MKIWKPVKEFDGLYEVNNYQEVRSLNYNREGRSKLLKQSFDKDGYKKVGLSRDCIVYNRVVHRLMALAFIPNPKNKPEVNHKNGVKHDNRLRNLEWATQVENAQHSVRVLGHKPPSPIFKGKYGKDIPFSRAIKQIDIKTGKVIMVYDCVLDVKRILGFDNSSIGKAAKGINKSSNGFKWEYV